MLTQPIFNPMTSVIAANACESEWPTDESVGKVRVCPLEYWLEQQVNINVYRLFVKRPDSLPDAVAQALPACAAYLDCAEGDDAEGRAVVGAQHPGRRRCSPW